jgi:hypothetical protein
MAIPIIAVSSETADLRDLTREYAREKRGSGGSWTAGGGGPAARTGKPKCAAPGGKGAVGAAAGSPSRLALKERELERIAGGY